MKYTVGYYTRALPTDVEWLKENPRADRLLMTRPRLASLLEYARSLIGCESWDHSVLADWEVWDPILGAAARSVAGPGLRRLKQEIEAAALRLRHRSVASRGRRWQQPPVRRVLFV